MRRARGAARLRSRSALVGLAVFLLVGLPFPGAAQWQGELRIGGAVGGYEPSGAGLQIEPGLSLRLSVSRVFSPLLSGYAAVGTASFGCSDGFCADQSMNFRQEGIEAGVRMARPERRLGPWLEAGVGLERLHFSTVVERSGARPGLAIGGGVAFDGPRDVALTPGLRYTRFSTRASEIDAGGDVEVLVLDLGIRLR